MTQTYIKRCFSEYNLIKKAVGSTSSPSIMAKEY